MATITKTSLLKDLTPAWLADFSKSRNEPAWLTALRQDAFKKYEQLAWPGKNDPQWKRTELELLGWEQREFAPTTSAKQTAPDATTEKLATLTGVTPDKNGSTAKLVWNMNTGYFRQVNAELEKAGVEWLPLDEAIVKYEAVVKEAWTNAVKQSENNKFRMLTVALGNGGFFLFIPKNKRLVTPIHRFISIAGKNAAQFPFNLVVLETEAAAHLWEELVSTDDATSFVSSYTSVYVKDGAQANLYNLQHWGDGTFHFQFQDIVQGERSSLNTVALAVGGRIFHNESTINLHGTGAENKVLGVLFGDKKQNFENWITQNHTARQTTSDIQYRGALKGASKSFFSGMVSITKEAQLSDAFQSAKSLLLSKDARADAIPNLEILADDVKCSHGAAVGPVDEDQKYYLQTRGVKPDVAEEIIIQGFFEPVIAAVPTEEVQERLRHFIEEKLAQP